MVEWNRFGIQTKIYIYDSFFSQIEIRELIKSSELLITRIDFE